MPPVLASDYSLYTLPLPLQALEPQQLKNILALSTVRRFRRGDLVFSGGEAATAVFCIQIGMLKLIRSRPQGPRIVHLALPGDMVGMASILAERPYSLAAVALSPGEAQVIDAASFLVAIRTSGPFCEAVLRQMSQDLTVARDSLAMQGDLPVHARLSRLLLDLHMRTLGSIAESSSALRLTRYDLAEILGSAQETISRSLGCLEDAGLIIRQGRSIQVRDADALRSVGDSDRSTVARTLESLKNRTSNDASHIGSAGGVRH